MTQLASIPSPDLIARWCALGDAGVTVSIVYGPSAKHENCIWSVLAESSNAGGFERPYHGRDFEHCLWIAETESKMRGWIA